MSNSTSNLDLLNFSQKAKETTANALFDAASPAMLFGRHAQASNLLIWGYYGGVVLVAGLPTVIDNGAITLTASATNYLYTTAAGVVTKVTTAPGGWPGPLASGASALFAIVTSATSATSWIDYRSSAGVSGGGGTSLPVVDTTALVKGSTDATKLLRIEVDGITTATTRTLTPQDRSYTIADKADVDTHIADTANPHAVTKTQVGLANVPNTDATNASNISSGTLAAARMVAMVGDSGSGGTKGAVPAPAAGDAAAGKYLKADGTFAVPGAAAQQPLNVISDATTARTLVIGDAYGYIRMTSGSPNTVTVPTNASVTYDVGTQITVTQAGVGQTTFVGDTGVTVNATALGIAARHDAATLIKVGGNEWDLRGALA